MNSAPLTLESLAVRVTSLEHSAEKNSVDHGKIYGRIEAVENGHAILDANLQNVKSLCEEIRSDVKELKEKPAKRWDMVINEAVKWIVIAALGAMVIFK